MMITLKREGQGVRIGPDIRVFVRREFNNQSLSLAIEAPDEIKIEHIELPPRKGPSSKTRRRSP